MPARSIFGAACSGFVYALSTATQFIQTGTLRAVLVIGVDTLTRFVDYSDRSTCILFGDGAGAVVIERSTEDAWTAFDRARCGRRRLRVISIIPGWGGYVPETAGIFPEYRPYLQMNGNEVFRFAVRVMGDAAVEAVGKAGLNFEDIDMLIPHQANARIIDAAARRLDLDREKVWVNLDRYGNTSAASIPIALCEAEEAGHLA